jgi:hypothetical protein
VVIVAERSRFERRFGYSPHRDEPRS